MLVLLAMIQLVGGAPIAPPPPPLPTPEQMQAAKALFSADPNAPINSWGINIAVAQVGGDALRARNVYTTERDFALDARLGPVARAGQAQIIDAALTCVATRYAPNLSVSEMEAVKAFITTPAGQRFWRVNQEAENWQGCFRRPTEEYLAPRLDAEIDAVVKQFPKGR